MRAALRLFSVKIDLGDLRRAFGRLRRLWRLDRCGARRTCRREHAEIDMFTWQWHLVDVVEAEFECAVLHAGLGFCVDNDEGHVAILEEVDGPAVRIQCTIHDVELDELAVLSNGRPQRRVDVVAGAESRIEEQILVCDLKRYRNYAPRSHANRWVTRGHIVLL